MPINIHTIKTSVLEFRRSYYKLFSRLLRTYVKSCNNRTAIFVGNDRIPYNPLYVHKKQLVIIHNTRLCVGLLYAGLLAIVRNKLWDQTEINESWIPSFRDCNSARDCGHWTEKNCVTMNIAVSRRTILRGRKYVIWTRIRSETEFSRFKRKLWLRECGY